MTKALSLVREFGFTLYDGEGNLAELVGPDAKTCLYTHDHLGRLKTVIRDGADVGVEYFYDEAGRPQRAEYLSGAKPG